MSTDIMEVSREESILNAVEGDGKDLAVFRRLLAIEGFERIPEVFAGMYISLFLDTGGSARKQKETATEEYPRLIESVADGIALYMVELYGRDQNGAADFLRGLEGIYLEAVRKYSDRWGTMGRSVKKNCEEETWITEKARIIGRVVVKFAERIDQLPSDRVPLTLSRIGYLFAEFFRSFLPR